MSVKAEIEQALTAHASWRKRFWDFLHGKGPMDLDAVGDSHRCAFGDWLDHEGRRLIPAECHAEVRSAHEAFHDAANRIVQQIKEKRYAQAREALGRDGALNLASAKLVDSLVRARLHEPSAAISRSDDKMGAPHTSQADPTSSTGASQAHHPGGQNPA